MIYSTLKKATSEEKIAKTLIFSTIISEISQNCLISSAKTFCSDLAQRNSVKCCRDCVGKEVYRIFSAEKTISDFVQRKPEVQTDQI